MEQFSTFQFDEREEIKNTTCRGIQYSRGFRRGALWMDDLFYGRNPAPRPVPEWTQIP